MSMHLPLSAAVQTVVADVRNSWPDASPRDAIVYVRETVDPHHMNDDDPTFLAYALVLAWPLGQLLQIADALGRTEEARRAGELEDGNLVVTKDQRTGRVRGSATLSPSGWLVSVTYDPQFAHLTAGGGADYAVADVTKLG